MLFRIEIQGVQHVSSLELGLDLEAHKLTCIVGKNGVGKTTLIKALRNLSHSDTFVRTASRGVFTADSRISYFLGTEAVHFEYDQNIRTLNCKSPISAEFKTLCTAELPVPFGDRFNFFQSISDADAEIRRQIILQEYGHPQELIAFLCDIYSSDKFRDLIEIRAGERSYYSILLGDDRYVREDYLSSGEYFLISLYRKIRGASKLIVVDEIDVSLDAAAQVHLLRKLREFCLQYGTNVLFTTHSIAMMRMLEPTELLYMEKAGDQIALTPAPYSYIKSLLFGFSGWDRYILTEDSVLHGFLEYLIDRYCSCAFYSWKIIHVGGATQVVDLLRRNSEERFLSDPGSVVAVLDGDQRDLAHARHPHVHCIPFQNVEAEVHAQYVDGRFPYRLAEGRGFNGPKDLFNALQSDRVVPARGIYEALCNSNEDRIADFVATLRRFLSL